MTRKQIAEMVKAIYKEKLNEIVVNPSNNTPAAQAYRNALSNNSGKPALPLQGGQKLSPIGDKSRGRVVKPMNRFVKPKFDVDAARKEAQRRRESGQPVLQAIDVPGLNRDPEAIKAAQQRSNEIMGNARQGGKPLTQSPSASIANRDRPGTGPGQGSGAPTAARLSPAAQQRGAEQDKVGVKRTTVPSKPTTSVSSGPENIKMSTQKAADDFKFTDKERAGKVSAERLNQFYQQKGLKSSGKTTQDLRTFMNAAKNKTLNTNVTPATELQKANQAKLQAGRTATTSSVVGGQGIAAIPGGGSAMSAASTPPKPTARPADVGSAGPARPTMAANAQAAGQMAVDRMRAQNMAKSQTSSMSAGMSSTAPKPTPPKPLSGGAGR